MKFSNISLELNRKHFNWWGDGDPIWLVVLKRNENSNPDKRATDGILAHDVTNLSMYNCDLRWNEENPESR